jgi:hypothetical protein
MIIFCFLGGALCILIGAVAISISELFSISWFFLGCLSFVSGFYRIINKKRKSREVKI